MVKENDQRIINNVVWVVGVLGDKNRITRGPTRDRNVRKEQWTELYNQKSAEEFSEKMRINRTTFNLLLNTLWDGLVLLEPTSPDRQLAASIYRLAHGVTYIVLEDVFGILKESRCIFFNKVICLIVAYFYDEYVKLPETDEQWEVEVGGFIKNYGFPAVGAWYGFHIHVNSQLKASFSFKKKYTVNNLALTSYNKRFLYAVIGAPGSTHDARMLKESSFFDEGLSGWKSTSRSKNKPGSFWGYFFSYYWRQFFSSFFMAD